MAEIKVTPQELRTKADSLQSHNTNFRSEVDKMMGYVSQLNGMWEGEARTAFHTAFSKDMIQLNNFATLIEKYIASLNQIAVKYENAEMQNTNIANTRKY